MENLQRPSEMSKKDRGHRKTEPSQHKGRACMLPIGETLIVKRHTGASQCGQPQCTQMIPVQSL